MRGFILSAAAAAFAILGAFAGPGSAKAEVYRAVNNGNLCIDLNQQTLKVATWTCNGGANQNFITPSYGQQRFVVNGQTLCLDSATTSQGADIVMRACNSAAQSQRWGQTSTGASAAVVLKNESGWCMDIPGGNPSVGTRLEIWQCNGGANQQFFRSGGASNSAVEAPAGGCSNGDIARAILEVTGRAPKGSGSGGECEPGQYRGFSSYHDLVNKVTVKLTSKGVAYVFSAPKLAIMQGHVGWAYLGDDMVYHIGATDAPITKFNLFQGNLGLIIPASPGANSPWRQNASTEQDMLNMFRAHGGYTDTYSEYKMTFVMQRNSNFADQRSNEAANWGYGLVGNNCADHVYRVLAAYGVDTNGVMRSLMTRGAPNSWFRAFGTMDVNGRVTSATNTPGAAL